MTCLHTLLFMMYTALHNHSGPFCKAGTVNLRFRVTDFKKKSDVRLLEHFTVTVILYHLSKPFIVFIYRNVRKNHDAY